MITMLEMKFSQYLTGKFLEWQSQQGERKTVAEFARWIGVKQSSVSMWWNNVNEPSGESVRLLANRFGLEIYDILGLDRPNESLYYVQTNWEKLPDDMQSKIKEQVAEYLTKKKKGR